MVILRRNIGYARIFTKSLHVTSSAHVVKYRRFGLLGSFLPGCERRWLKYGISRKIGRPDNPGKTAYDRWWDNKKQR